MWTAVSVTFHTPGNRDLNVYLSLHTNLPQKKKGCTMPSIMLVLDGYNQREIVTGTRMCGMSRAGSKLCMGFAMGVEQTDQSNLGNLDFTFKWVWRMPAAQKSIFWMLNTDMMCLCPTAIIPDINRL